MPRLRRLAIVVAMLSLSVVSCRTPTHADPSAFPDVSSYPPVNVADYSIALPNPGRGTFSQVFFLTPDGNVCTLINAGAECTGNNFPGIAPVSQDPAKGLVGVNGIRTDIGLQPTNTPLASADNTVQGHPVQSLPALHSISQNGAICGVDGTGTTACKDSQGRGFVLSPQQGTVWLPHV